MSNGREVWHVYPLILLRLVDAGRIDQSVMPTPATLYVSAVVLGVGMGVTTPLGFAHIAATTPAQRTGRTMGAAEA